MSRMSIPEYAKLKGVNQESLRRMCRVGKKVKARIGLNGQWEIDVEATETLLSIKYGNALEKSLAGVKSPTR